MRRIAVPVSEETFEWFKEKVLGPGGCLGRQYSDEMRDMTIGHWMSAYLDTMVQHVKQMEDAQAEASGFLKGFPGSVKTEKGK